MSEDETAVFVDYEVSGVRIKLDDRLATLEQIPDVHPWPIIAESTRPETISDLTRKGFASACQGLLLTRHCHKSRQFSGREERIADVA